ncbi:hypothetical protein M011DRAFT_33469 [Sporormia fimetaria CBS 119925]|uniref:Uncharacterized protein n=1 Tax=Sporormia fimetaria CBS 119925 TaxID=1340428 RepID=A0A6A6VEG0_9PLEO|nr:hypothetical protein M011DRAFT_33469 [Sporormia fimetaria CBS 119925]
MPPASNSPDKFDVATQPGHFQQSLHSVSKMSLTKDSLRCQRCSVDVMSARLTQGATSHSVSRGEPCAKLKLMKGPDRAYCLGLKVLPGDFLPTSLRFFQTAHQYRPLIPTNDIEGVSTRAQRFHGLHDPIV